MSQLQTSPKPFQMLLAVWRAVQDHVRSSFPLEAVGLLAGKGIASLGFPLENIGPGGTVLAEPYSQFVAESNIRIQGLELLGIYHSHPNGCTCLSETDKYFAKGWPCAQIVISFASSSNDFDVVAYRLVEDNLCPLEVVFL